MNGSLLAQQIETAFADVDAPGVANIAPHRCAECDELRDDFGPYKRAEIPRAVFHKHVWDLPLLSDQARLYFFPAWLLASLIELDSNATDAALTSLGMDQRWFSTCRLSAGQRTVVLAWLENIATGDEVVSAESAFDVLERWSADA